MLLSTAAIRVRLLDVPLERDEGEYAYAGQLLLQGVAPYAATYNFKMPGTYFAYAVILALLGQTASAVHLGLLVTNAATAVLLFVLARRLYDPVVGLVASASFLALSLNPRLFSTTAHAEHFVLLHALAGILIVLRAMETNRLLAFLIGGLLLGIGMLMKQSGVVFVLFGVLYVVLGDDGPSTTIAVRLRAAAAVLAGGLLPLAVVLVGLLGAGTLGTFWFWAFRYGAWYGSALPLPHGLYNLNRALGSIVPSSAILLGLAGLGVMALAGQAGARKRWRFMTAFVLASLLGVSFGLYFRHQYFVLLLPSVALLAGVGVAFTGRALASWQSWTAWAGSAALALVACLQPVLLDRSNRVLLFQLSPVAVSRAMYHGNPFVETVEIAKYIRARTSGEDRIAVVGSEPQIYFYAGRRSGTGYIYTYPLMEAQPFAGRMQREMIKEIEAARPRYLVWVSAQNSWLMRPGSDTTIFQWLDDYRRRNFRQVGVIDLLPGDRTLYYWGDQAATYTPRSTTWLAVYERDDSRDLKSEPR
jgi:hypothetical protein